MKQIVVLSLLLPFALVAFGQSNCYEIGPVPKPGEGVCASGVSVMFNKFVRMEELGLPKWGTNWIRVNPDGTWTQRMCFESALTPAQEAALINLFTGVYGCPYQAPPESRTGPKSTCNVEGFWEKQAEIKASIGQEFKIYYTSPDYATAEFHFRTGPATETGKVLTNGEKRQTKDRFSLLINCP